MSLDEETWAEIARLWCEGTEPVGAIAGRYDVSHQRIVAAARARQWPQRGSAAARVLPVGRAARPPATRGKGASATAAARSAANVGSGGQATARGAPLGKRSERKPGRPARRKRATRTKAVQRMVERLFGAMEAKLSDIEQRMAAGADETPADGERTARSIGTLSRACRERTVRSIMRSAA